MLYYVSEKKLYIAINAQYKIITTNNYNYYKYLATGRAAAHDKFYSPRFERRAWFCSKAE